MKTYNTHQRKSLIDFLQSNSEKAFTIEEIINGIGGEISQSTAYRLMTKLVEDGLVHRTVKGNSRSFVYQYISDKKCDGHLHMKCTDCGKVYHLDSNVTAQIHNNILNSTSFEVDNHTVLMGKCGMCK
ncbi:MAG: transcriptional repressor [Acutalibacteraceae bacterium]|nr:transcriptional repressor [Acutalibacteraceae bacterium]